MESFSNLILNNAQTVRDGGIISSILQNVKLLNNSHIRRDVKPYLLSTRMTGGYVAALIFGVLWIIILLSTMIFLFYLFLKSSKKSANLNYIKKSTPKKSIKGKLDSTSYEHYFQMFAIIIFLIPTILLLCFCIANVSQIHNSISNPARGFEVNSTRPVTAILPAIKKSVFHIRHYLSTFANLARANTAPVVEEIIQATKDMQKETMIGFNAKLMRRLGVENTFKYGGQMTNIVVNFFDVSNSLLDNQTLYNDVIRDLYPRVMNPSFGLFNFISDIKNSFNSLPECDEGCKELETYFSKSFSEVSGFPETSFATSFLFVMKQQNKTRQSVIAQTQHGRKEMDKTMAKTQLKMKKLLDIDGTIRNMTGETWTKMEEKFENVLGLLDNVTALLDNEATSNKVSHYSGILAVVLYVPILLAIVILIVAVSVIINFYIFPLKPLHIALRVAIYVCLFLLSIIMFASTITFLYGGKFETELCRYLRTSQPIVVTHNETRLVLDSSINEFLRETMPKIAKSAPKSDFPLPKPRNVLYGLINRCQKDEPILAAIDAINSLDTAALSKPEVAAKFIRIGRMLLLESLNETDPKKMLPPDMQDSLQQASQLGMFKNIDFQKNIDKVPRTPIFIEENGEKTPIPTVVFIDKIEKYIKAYVKDPTMKNKLKADLDKLMPLLERFNIITDRVRSIFQEMKTIPSIKPVVANMKRSLESMLLILNNKTLLFEIGNEYFDKIIVSSTPKKAAGIMKTFGPKMMSKLGHCRPIFDAYQLTIDTTCDVVVMKLNVYWLYLGAVGLLLTCFLSMVFLMMFRTYPSLPDQIDEKAAKSLLESNENPAISTTV